MLIEGRGQLTNLEGQARRRGLGADRRVQRRVLESACENEELEVGGAGIYRMVTFRREGFSRCLTLKRKHVCARNGGKCSK